ncbi:BETA-GALACTOSIDASE [Salix koriyanagi]|uniref:beta-galactosidase n=2 Tax=Salix TaxID=40685 RepID=A0A9Q0PNA3_9ROSI|nr:BETA-GALACTOSIDASE [Salix koriyanagi]
MLFIFYLVAYSQKIENEYGDVENAYGENGWKYVEWCSDLVESFEVGVPWIMCKQDNAPFPISPKSDSTPKIWTENWSGWFKTWGSQDPHRTAEDLAFAVARFYQLGGAVQNYYMYHGGTNFGKTAGGPYITTSYDYDAPLDEYGNLNQPKWGHLKALHEILMSLEKTLTYGSVEHHDYQNLQYVSFLFALIYATFIFSRLVTVYSYQGNRTCFMSTSNNYDFHLNFEGNDYVIPAWSVSILPDCYTDVYNTAKVNAQTSIMVKKPNVGEDPDRLEWVWRPEHALHVDKTGSLKGSTMVANELLDQKRVTNGSQWSTDGDFNYFILEKSIKLKHGTNRLSLLSVTVGLPNYGAFYDKKRVGVHGPVKLIAKTKNGDVERNISSNQWVYKTGLHGEELGLHLVESHHNHNWKTENRPENRKMIWYKTTFTAPLGTDPVVVDLLGLGKGVAWVNGFDIGRYWPKQLAPEEGCEVECDYRRTYSPSSCQTNCGKPSQRWYHIPRSLLKADDNVLVLFEEFGGTPDLVSIQTVTVGTVCADAYEGQTLELSCQGGNVFSRIKFASFGLPEGSCGSFNKGTCHAENTLPVVKDACLGKEKCSLKIAEETFGVLRCKADAYRLAVEAVLASFCNAMLVKQNVIKLLSMRTSVNRPPTPDDAVEEQEDQEKQPTLQEIINIKLIESGEKERLMELLRERLIECGWKDEMKALCRFSLPSHVLVSLLFVLWLSFDFRGLENE